MRVKCYEIKWDLDEEDYDNLPYLPEVMEIHLPEGAEPSIEGADHLSDLTGFCVDSFKFEVLD